MMEHPLPEPHEAELVRLVARHRRGSRGGIELINLLGTWVEGWMPVLPAPLRAGVEQATQAALMQAAGLAQGSRRQVPDQPGWVNLSMGAALGVAGGVGGMPTVLAELPVTTTLLLRVIQGQAAALGFDPEEASVQFDCVAVFGSAGPLARDDGADTGFLGARLALSGAALQKLIATVAPRLAVVLGQKLAAQSVPVLGAVAGAAVNAAYLRYYREMAQVQFGLRRLAVEAGVPEPELIERFRARLDAVPFKAA